VEKQRRLRLAAEAVARRRLAQQQGQGSRGGSAQVLSKIPKAYRERLR